MNIQHVLASFPRMYHADLVLIYKRLAPKSKYTTQYTQCANWYGETLHIPDRIYWKPRTLSALEPRHQLLLHCLYTRHHDGFVRQRSVEYLLHENEDIALPFLVISMGDYVEEILHQIYQHRTNINAQILCDFLRQNQPLYHTIHQRIYSYWNCYYRHLYPKYKWKPMPSPNWQDYPGIGMLSYLDKLLGEKMHATSGQLRPTQKSINM